MIKLFFGSLILSSVMCLSIVFSLLLIVVGCTAGLELEMNSGNMLQSITGNRFPDSKITFFRYPETGETIIEIENVEIDDFSVIVKQSPDILSLNNCTIKDIDNFYKLPIKHLQLDSCRVPLLVKRMKIKSIESIYFKDTPLGNYSFLSGQPLVLFAVINDNDLKELSSLPILSEGIITIVNCKNIIDFSALKKQSFIKHLSIKNSPLKDISFISSLESLKILNLIDTEVDDISTIKDSKIKIYFNHRKDREVQ